MIQFIAAAAVGVGMYAAAKAFSREMKRVSNILNDEPSSESGKSEKVMRLERDETTGRYRPVDRSEDRGPR